MTEDLQIKCLKGAAIVPHIPDVAKLRMKIFKNYPYLYMGDLEYEKKYLQIYAACQESVIVVVLDKNKVVGVSTAIPLEFETEEVKKPFQEQGVPIQKVFYFGESVLLPEYRGKKVYRQFFQEREQAAKQYGCNIVSFCAVERPLDDVRRPKDYVPLDKVWQHFGYTKHPELCAYFKWKEIGEEVQSAKPLIFWTKNI